MSPAQAPTAQEQLHACQTILLATPAPAIDTESALARIRLILLLRFRALIAIFLRDPNAHLSHSDFTTLTRALNLHAPNKKRKEAPSPIYLHLQRQALNILNARITRFHEERKGGHESDAIPTLMARIIGKATRLTLEQSASESGHSEPRVFERARNHEGDVAILSTSEAPQASSVPSSVPSSYSSALPATESQQHPSDSRQLTQIHEFDAPSSSPSPVHPCSSVAKPPVPLTGQAKRRLKAQLHEHRKAQRRTERANKLQAA